MELPLFLSLFGLGTVQVETTLPDIEEPVAPDYSVLFPHIAGTSERITRDTNLIDLHLTDIPASWSTEE